MPFSPTYAFARALLGTARVLTTRADAALSPFGLTSASWIVLLEIVRSQDRSVGQLAEACGVSKARASVLVDSLVRSGWVERRRPDDDRRRVVLSLTDLGRDVVRSAAADTAGVLRPALEALDASDVAAAQQVLDRVLATLATAAGDDTDAATTADETASAVTA
ncbi:MAG: MarR family winged helix-turn-helix transcriptional regulator [Kineosporiaceae bacterium]